jgi:hypothetical protein
MSPGEPQKRSLLPSGGPMKLLLILGGAVVLVIVIIVLANLLSGSNPAAKSFLAVAQQQQEIARVAGLQEPDTLTGQSAKNLAITTKLSMQSDSAALTTYMQKNGMKASSKQLADTTNSATDTKLRNAENTNTLDTTLVSELQTELKAYQTALKQAYAQTSGPNGRALLVSLNKHVTLLLEQSAQ